MLWTVLRFNKCNTCIGNWRRSSGTTCTAAQPSPSCCWPQLAAQHVYAALQTRCISDKSTRRHNSLNLINGTWLGNTATPTCSFWFMLPTHLYSIAFRIGQHSICIYFIFSCSVISLCALPQRSRHISNLCLPVDRGLHVSLSFAQVPICIPTACQTLRRAEISFIL